MAPLGYNVASIVVNMLAVAFFAVVAIGIGFLAYAAKELKKRETGAGE
jgi:uncharacterized UPF0146 family protein